MEKDKLVDPKVSTLTIGMLLSWIFGLFFLLSGFVGLLTDLLFGTALILIAIVLLPPTNVFLEKNLKFSLSGGLKALLIIILLFWGGSTLPDIEKSPSDSQQEEKVTNTDDDKTIDTSDNEGETTKEEEKNTEPKEVTKEATMGEKNALRSAQAYLDYSAFSYNGLIKQLQYEGYSKADATYAVNNCGANWNEQAAKSAKSYLEYSAFSRKELIDQLRYEGFSAKQAEYGVKAVGY